MVHRGQLPSFFREYGLDSADWQQCLAFVESRYPGHDVDHKIEQGGCSYTVKLTPPPRDQQSGHVCNEGTPFIVQFRPARFALSLEVADAAKRWYGELAPSVSEIGRLVAGEDGRQLIAYRMSYIAGKRFDEVQPRARTLGPGMLLKYRTLLGDLAEVYAVAWQTGMRDKIDRGQCCCDGKVGSSLPWRLRRLANELPSSALRSTAKRANDAVEVGVLDRLPIVFTHGDFLPSNILVENHTWHVNGLIDWAESEHLPFGISLYGLEHLLGSMSDCRFTYLHEACSLRGYFWQRLTSVVPEMEQEETREAVKLAPTVGILLWHGFAWDDGRIDRVVEPVRDAEELEYLEACLGTGGTGSTARL